MIADRVALRPTPRQAAVLMQHCEWARQARNWAIGEWQRQYRDHKAGATAWSGEGPQERPFVRRKPKTATQPGIEAMMPIIKRDGRLPAWAAGLLSLTRNKHLSHVEDAWVNFWDDQRRPAGSRLGVRQPKPKKRSARPSFYLHNQSFRIENGRLVVGRIGAIKLQHEPRYAHRILSATVSFDAGRWHISILRELDRQRRRADPGSIVGIKLGVREPATTNDGEVCRTAGATPAEERRLKRLQRRFSRRGVEDPQGKIKVRRGGRTVRVKTSKRREKARAALAKLHARIRRRDANRRHVFTRALAERAAVVGVENVRVNRLTRTRPDEKRSKDLNRGIQRAAWHTTKRQLGYKVAEHGGAVIEVDAAFSIQDCHVCGARSGPDGEHEAAVSDWTCSRCGTRHWKPVNAAINVKRKTEDCLAARAADENPGGMPDTRRPPGTATVGPPGSEPNARGENASRADAGRAGGSTLSSVKREAPPGGAASRSEPVSESRQSSSRHRARRPRDNLS